MSQNEIELPLNLLTDQLSVVIIQINFKLDRVGNPPIYDYKNSSELERKVFFILHRIEELKVNPNLIVFPEYSMTKKFLDRFQDYSDRNSVIIIAGRHHNPETLENVCPIIVPGIKHYFCKKRYIDSKVEKFVKPAKKAGQLFRWRHNNKDYSLQIFLCADYLQTALQRDVYIDEKRTGIIIVPMNSKNIVDYYNLANIHLMDKRGKFIVLCNACGVTLKQYIHACGQSAIFGSYEHAKRYYPLNGGNERYTSRLGEFEGWIQVEFNLLEPKIILKEGRSSFSTEMSRPPLRIVSQKKLKSAIVTHKKFQLKDA